MSERTRSPTHGGSLSDFAVRGTSVPEDNPTQTISPSQADDRASKLYDQTTGYADLVGAADNVTALPQGTGTEYQGRTGEVVTGTGDRLPSEAEMKFVGGGTRGGKERQKRNAKSKGDVSA